MHDRVKLVCERLARELQGQFCGLWCWAGGEAV